MQDSLPLVSVITPTYNRADLLEETIESVLSQDYPNIEYIVLDDGSKDNTRQVLEKYNGRIIWGSHPNMGETLTVNKGFEMAKGEIICVVNSDDPILPGAIKKMVLPLMSDPDALVVYPDWVEIGPTSEHIREMKLSDYNIYNMLNTFNVGLGPGTMFKSSVLRDYGYRDVKRKYTGDLEFWYRLACHGKFIHIPEILATHRTHPHSLSVSDKNSKISEELISMVKTLFASGVLPKELQKERKKILSRIYHSVIFYSPREPIMIGKYLLLSFFSDPIMSIASAFRRANHYLFHWMIITLKKRLPAPAYNKLRARRRGR